MSQTLLRSAPKQFLDCASWKESISSAFVPLEVSALHPGRFRSSVADDELAWLRVSELHTSAQRVSRSRLQANQSESAGYKVTLQLSGRSEIRQASRRALLAPGEWGVYDTTRPYEVDVDDNAHFLVMQVPGRQVQAWEPYMQNAVARVFSARQGCGRMAMDLLRVALGEHAHLSERGARRGQCRDADDGAGHQRARWQPCRPGAGRAAPGATAPRAAAHPGEPARSRAVAGHGRTALRVSRRYLYNLFAQASTTPADFILSARLERCRDMLCDAAQAARQIGDIAFRYGFSDAARFSHAFRRRYGVSPSEYRRRAVENATGR
ncbi:helix-turn-helix domain-containing protein [Achromobacter xylosoxidans]